MVLDYYQLAEQPFGVTPDPRFLYASATHREAIASVLYGVKSGRGFTALIAEPGMGKTTVLFNLLQQLGGTAKTAFLFQHQDNPRNFLRNLLLDLGIEDDGQDLVRMHVKLNDCLVQETSQGKHFVVVVDEAQNLDEPVLEVVRMLSNFETPREKLMHIILAGQPQLAQKLALPQLKQLRQRVSIVARLKPFNAGETRAYIEHRLSVAGYRAEVPLFTDRAFELIAQYSGGIPRNINNICFNAISLGCAIKRKTIHAEAVEEVLNDLDLLPLTAPAPLPEYHAARVAPRGVFARLAPAAPQRWLFSAAIVALAGLLAGFGWAVVAKSLRFAPPAPANSSNHSQSAAPALPEPVPSTPVGTPGVDASPTAPSAVSDLSSDRVASPPAPPASAPAASAAHSEAGPQTASSANSTLIRVGADETMYKICIDNFGRYDAHVLALIRELNPNLDDPRRLHAGQQLRIPTPASLYANTSLSAESLGTTSALEAKKR